MIKLPGYEVEDLLHESDHTIVYRGYRESDRKPVVIKTTASPRPRVKRTKRLRREFELGRRFDCDEVIRYLDLVPVGMTVALILEDFGGQILHDRIPDQGMSIEVFLAIAIKLSRGLARIHEQEVVHKDIKPGNIIINDVGIVKFIDFGISSRLSREYQTSKAPDALEGTPAYMSPEQTGRMNRALDYRSDFYSLGVTLYQMLTGELPFETRDTLELIHCHIARAHMPACVRRPKIPLQLSNIIEKLLSKDVEARYQSATGLEHDLNICRSNFIETGQIQVFPLGRNDVSEKFHIPEKLYGRERDFQVLLNAFMSAAQGACEMIIVRGEAGIGKTVLVKELQKTVAGHRGFFVSGKFDKQRQSESYSALCIAFSELVQQLLGENERVVKFWRERLLRQLGEDTAVVAGIVPDLGLVLGDLAPPVKLDPSENRTRFQRAVTNFLKSLGDPRHPLVLFLDDLQWADSASIHLIELLMNDKEVSNILLIGSWRDEENSPHSLADLTLEFLKTNRVVIPELRLGNLTHKDLSALVGDALGRAPVEVSDLARVVLEKTNGNPFFVCEFLRSLYREKLISYDRGQQCWIWNEMDIQNTHLSENVVDLMIRRLADLDESARKALQLGACMGSIFEHGALARLLQLRVGEVAACLHDPLEQGLVESISGNYLYSEVDPDDEGERCFYRFQHDRVRQAAYDQLDETERVALHLKIGRSLMYHQPDGDEQVVDIVYHMNLGLECLDDPEELEVLAHYNLIAGKRALASVAYKAAVNFLDIARQCLSEAAWDSNYQLTVDVYRNFAEASYLCGQYDTAKQAWDEWLHHARDDLERAGIMELQMVHYITRDRLETAEERGFEALDLLDIHLPRKPMRLHLIREAQRVRRQLKDRDEQALLNLPELADDHVKAALNILMRLSLSAFFNGQRNLYALVALRRTRLILTHGNCAEAANAYATYGLLLAAVKRYKDADKFGKLALALDDRYRCLPLRCKVFFIYGFNILPWNHHWKHMGRYLQKAVELGIQSGDYLYSTLACAMVAHWDPTLDLESATELGQKYIDVLRSSRFQGYAGEETVLQLFRLALRGRTSDPLELNTDLFSEEQFLERADKVPAGRGMYYTVKLQLAYFFDAPEGMTYLKQGDRVIKAMVSTPFTVDFSFFGFLTLASRYQELNLAGQRRAKKRMMREFRTMNRLAEHCACNFEHRALLMAAELDRIEGRYWQALEHYKQAIQSAHTHQFLAVEAICNERAALFALEQDQEHLASIYYREAHHLFSCWGADAKVNWLRRSQPSLLYSVWFSGNGDDMNSVQNTTSSMIYSNSFNTTSEKDGTLSSNMDIFIRSALDMSSEMNYTRLLSKVISLVVACSGANRGALISDVNGELAVVAAVGHGEMKDGWSVPLKRARVCARMISYVFRTGEIAISGGSEGNDMFSRDPYFKERSVKSVLCLPIRHKDRIYAGLYLEHRHLSRIFTPEKIELLSLLTSQAAISMENARLFTDARDSESEVRKLNTQLAGLHEDLEKRVTEQTEQLQVAQDQLLSKAHEFGMAEIAMSVLHNVGTILNSVITSGQMIRTTVEQSKLEGLVKANEMLREQMDNIESFIREDPKGHALLKYYLQFDKHFEREKEVISENLSRLQEKVEMIRSVIMAQQTYASSRGMQTEPVALSQILDDALQICAGELSEAGVVVETDYAQTPKLSLPRQKVINLLLHIIKNAIQAMESQAFDRRTLRVETRIESDMVQVNIRDSGEGIEANNLEHVFEQGFTTRRLKHGLGLHTCVNSMLDMGGRIECLSDGRGTGTTFVLSFPMKQPDTSAWLSDVS